MNAVTTQSAAAERLAWLENRRTGIGGSDIAAILGLSPWRSALDVYLDKTGQTPIDTGIGEPAYWGTVLEDVVATEFATRTGLQVQRVRQTIRSPSDHWMLASIDRAVVVPGSRARLDKDGRLCGASALLECKTANAYALQDWQGEDFSDSLPVHYAAQCMWYLAVTGLEECHVSALIGGQVFLLRKVVRDEETIDAMIAAARHFWFGHVLSNLPPEPRTGRDAAKLFTRDSGELIEADESTVMDVQELKALREKSDEIESQIDAIQDRLKARIGAASGLTIGGLPAITWKAAKDSKRTDWQGLANSLQPAPELIAQFTSTSPGSRRFLVK